ncbi:MAG: hypothetical protein GXP37_10825 [Chloroflexi bacterium]|nr:hypothetical protein [Chloroflexota bacterium]
MATFAPPPYWHGPLDRWKLAFSLLMLALVVILGARSSRTPQYTTPAFTFPAPGAVFSMNASPQITGIADPGHLIQIYDDDRFLGATTADAAGNWSYTLPTALFPGEHNLRARSLADADTPVATSAKLTLMIAPAMQQSPQFHIRVDTYQADQTFVLSGTADANTTIQLFDGVTRLDQIVSDDSGQWSFTVPGRSAGLHTFYARVMGANNTPLASSPPLDINIIAP